MTKIRVKIIILILLIKPSISLSLQQYKSLLTFSEMFYHKLKKNVLIFFCFLFLKQCNNFRADASYIIIDIKK